MSNERPQFEVVLKNINDNPYYFKTGFMRFLNENQIQIPPEKTYLLPIMFKVFSYGTYALENTHFLAHASSLLKQKNISEAEFKNIYNIYLAPDSPLNINIPSRLKNAVENVFNSFDEKAARNVLVNLHTEFSELLGLDIGKGTRLKTDKEFLLKIIKSANLMTASLKDLEKETDQTKEMVFMLRILNAIEQKKPEEIEKHLQDAMATITDQKQLVYFLKNTFSVALAENNEPLKVLLIQYAKSYLDDIQLYSFNKHLDQLHSTKLFNATPKDENIKLLAKLNPKEPNRKILEENLKSVIRDIPDQEKLTKFLIAAFVKAKEKHDSKLMKLLTLYAMSHLDLEHRSAFQSFLAKNKLLSIYNEMPKITIMDHFKQLTPPAFFAHGNRKEVLSALHKSQDVHEMQNVMKETLDKHLNQLMATIDKLKDKKQSAVSQLKTYVAEIKREDKKNWSTGQYMSVITDLSDRYKKASKVHFYMSKILNKIGLNKETKPPEITPEKKEKVDLIARFKRTLGR